MNIKCFFHSHQYTCFLRCLNYREVDLKYFCYLSSATGLHLNNSHPKQIKYSLNHFQRPIWAWILLKRCFFWKCIAVENSLTGNHKHKKTRLRSRECARQHLTALAERRWEASLNFNCSTMLSALPSSRCMWPSFFSGFHQMNVRILLSMWEKKSNARQISELDNHHSFYQ